MALFPDGLRARVIEGPWLADPSITLALKRMTAVVLIAVAVLLGSVGVDAVANGQEQNIPYWAGYEGVIPGTKDFTLTISFSKNGKSYTAGVEHALAAIPVIGLS